MTSLSPLRPHARRMTLVELLVAVALGMILIGVVTFVWIQSNKIFTTTVHRLETYQRLRSVIDTVERDLANTARTMNMEFFSDENANGHYDEDDEPLEVGSEHFRTPRDPSDPLAAADAPEFALANFPPEYLFGPTVLSPEPYEIGAGYTDGRRYWRDEVYVRSFAAVNGVSRPALIHYRLVQTADGRSVLRRRVWYLSPEGEIVYPGTAAQEATDRVSLLAAGVADFKVGFYFKESTSEGVGHWFHVGDAGGTFGDDGADLVQMDEVRGFRTALRARPQGIMADPFGGGQNAISFVYQGNARIERRDFGPVVLRTLDGDADTDLSSMLLRPGTSADLAHYDGFDFPGVRPGDRFLVFDATDDDEGERPDGAGVAAESYFPDRIFTVDEIFSESSDEDEQAIVAVKFREPIQFFRLSQSWLGEEPDVEITDADVGDFGSDTYWAGPSKGRTVTASFNVRYRVGFLPAAFLIRISSDDTYNRKVLPMERVIRLVQQ